MSSLREQCDFMSNVVRHAILMGMDHEQFVKLAETAWLVLTAEPAPAPETSVTRCTCKDFPGADQFCTAHSTANRESAP